MVARTLLRNSTSILGMVGHNYSPEILYSEKAVPCDQLPAINYKEKKCFLGTNTLPWITVFSY